MWDFLDNSSGLLNGFSAKFNHLHYLTATKNYLVVIDSQWTGHQSNDFNPTIVHTMAMHLIIFGELRAFLFRVMKDSKVVHVFCVFCETSLGWRAPLGSWTISWKSSSNFYECHYGGL